ncbi:unnamed protein product [Polarella glacialis]|uniref:Uncharacterized protein n=1 Tax=Polarella glacialis TaxID=89957 RepID=A0A813H270_POLGL|nr:unnamed protein product [Polarella glacialis]
MASGVFALTLFLLCDLALGEAGHEGHCPWTNHWEWSGMFQAQEGDWLSWNVEKGENGEYAEDSMKMIVLAGDHLEDLEDMAENLFHGNLTTAASGAVLLPGAAYLLSFSKDLWLSQFKIQAPVGGKLAFFTEHLPQEFENKLHYLKEADGHDVEPMEEESSMECAEKVVDAADAGIERVQEKRWAEVIGASFLTIIPSIFGIAVLAFSFSKQLSSWGKQVLLFANSGACGVVFAAAIFLLMPESMELVSAGKEEGEAAGVWGAAVIGGWFLGVLIDHSCSIVTWMWAQKSASDVPKEECECHGQEVAEARDPEIAVSPGSSQEPKITLIEGRAQMSIAGPVIFGDMFHNLADGFVLGAAFKSCDPSFGLKITLVTMAHEVPQELADFMILVHHAGMNWKLAALVNFLSGCSTLVGAVIAHGMDVSGEVEGMTLAAGAGIYLYVAATELGPSVAHLPRLQRGSSLCKASLARLLAFALGAICIGLVLLDHKHCTPVYPSSAEGAGAAADAGGHNHR